MLFSSHGDRFMSPKTLFIMLYASFFFLIFKSFSSCFFEIEFWKTNRTFFVSKSKLCDISSVEEVPPGKNLFDGLIPGVGFLQNQKRWQWRKSILKCVRTYWLFLVSRLVCERNRWQKYGFPYILSII